MSLLAHLSVEELGHLLQTMERSLQVDSHYALFNWLHKDVQRLIPHEVVIAAWGDFSLGLVCHDVVSSLEGFRTRSFSDTTLQPFTSWLFDRWMGHRFQPFINEAFTDSALQSLEGESTIQTFQDMKTGLVHGIKDQRGRHDCLYVLLTDNELPDKRKTLESLRFLLPYIDASFRQISHLPGQYYGQPRDIPSSGNEAEDTGGSNNAAVEELSARELEIMAWVRKGKTNSEIGTILDISAFTVKNHMQRILKKLDVLNRAQAVARMDSYRHPSPRK